MSAENPFSKKTSPQPEKPAENPLSESVDVALERRNSERIKEALEQVDFDVIKDIFHEIWGRYGIDASKQESIHVRKFIGRDEVRPNLTGEARTSAAGAIAITKEEIVNRPGQEFTTIEPVIEFNPLSRAFREDLQAPGESFPILPTVLKCINHEEVHATQFTGKVEMPDAGGARHSSIKGIAEQTITVRESDADTIDMQTGQESNTLLNEGLVEVIADQVTDEYLSRTGQSELIGKYFKTYPAGRMILELLVHKVSAKTGALREAVLNDLIGMSYKGASLLHGEFGARMGEDATDFLEKYGELSSDKGDYEEKVEGLCREFVHTIDMQKCQDQTILAFIEKKGLLPQFERSGESPDSDAEREERQRRWDAKMAEILKPDEYGYVINPGVRETVAALQLNGFNTVQSDEGNYGETPSVQVEEPKPKDIYVGEEAIKNALMERLDIRPDEIDAKSPSFSREKQVEIEEGARDQLLAAGAAYSPEFLQWQERTGAMAANLKEAVNEFYAASPQPEDAADLRVSVEFPYRAPQYPPYIQDTPLLQVNFADTQKVENASEEERKQLSARALSEMQRFSAFLKSRFLSEAKNGATGAGA